MSFQYLLSNILGHCVEALCWHIDILASSGDFPGSFLCHSTQYSVSLILSFFLLFSLTFAEFFAFSLFLILSPFQIRFRIKLFIYSFLVFLWVLFIFFFFVIYLNFQLVFFLKNKKISIWNLKWNLTKNGIKMEEK